LAEEIQSSASGSSWHLGRNRTSEWC